MTIDKLANTPFLGELERAKLTNNSKLFWELVIEKFIHDMNSKLEKLASEIDKRFARLEDRMEELASHFGRIYD